jgi:transcriptional regulator with XRE-family HTH domain
MENPMQFVDSAKTFGALVRQRRRDLGLSQVQLALSTGTGERFINELERGKPTCQLDKAFHVAVSLGIKLGDLAMERSVPEAVTKRSAREVEADMLRRCAEVAHGLTAPSSQQEANIFLVAGNLISSTYREEALEIRSACGKYFENHPGERLSVDDVIKRGWVPSLPRLRDNLSVLLARPALPRAEH